MVVVRRVSVSRVQKLRRFVLIAVHAAILTVLSILGMARAYGQEIADQSSTVEAPISYDDEVGAQQATTSDATDDLEDIGKPSIEAMAADSDAPKESERQIQMLSTSSDGTSANGAFNYNVPISLPPGIANFTPSIGLSYSSSNRSNGVIGVGWSFAASSCIERTGKKYVDPSGNEIYGAGAPTFAETDTFKIDGTPLIYCNDSYGGVSASCPNGTYRAQRNDFARVERQPSQLPNGWIVRLPNGEVLEYGDVRYGEGQPHTFQGASEFCLSTKRSGPNTISYSYHPTTGLLTKIKYGQPAVGFGWEVLFSYEARPDVQSRLLSGRIQDLTSRLKGILVKSASPTGRLRYYEMGYDQSPTTGASRLKTITEQGRTRSDTLPPYQFDYDDTATVGFVAQPPVPTPDPGYIDHNAPVFGLDNDNWLVSGGYEYADGYPNPLVVPENSRGLQFADLNRDGYPDLIRHDSGLTGLTRVWMNQLDPASGKRQFVASNTATHYFDSQPYFTTLDGTASVNNGTILIDLNGDGLTDIVQANAPDKTAAASDTGTYYVGIWNESNKRFEESSLALSFKTALRDNQITLNLFHRGSHASRHMALDAGVQIADVNGDSLPDIVISRQGFGAKDQQWNKDRQEVWLNNGSTFEQAPSGTWQLPLYFTQGNDIGTSPSELSASQGVQIVDVNGDGLPDIVQSLTVNNTNIPATVWLNYGLGWRVSNSFSTSLQVLQTGDYTRSWGINRLTSWANGTSVTNYNNPRGVAIIDVNHDGLPDLVKSECALHPELEGDCATGRDKATYLNTGNGWSSVDATNFHIPGALKRYVGMMAATSVEHDGGIFIGDINRDGAVDLLENRSYEVGTQYIHHSKSDRGIALGAQSPLAHELLKTITTPYGGTIKPTFKIYDDSGEAIHVPFALLVVDSNTYDNGLPLDNPAHWSSTKNFRFNGRTFDFAHAEFSGFAAQEATTNLDRGTKRIVTTRYRVDSAHRCMAGATQSVVIHQTNVSASGDRVFVNPADSPSTFGILKTTEYSAPNCPDNQRGPFFNQSTTVINKVYDARGLAKSTKQISTYDNFGNLQTQQEFEDSADAAPYRTRVFGYSPSSADNWIIDRTCRVTLNDVNNVHLRVKETIYDDAAATACAPISGLGRPVRTVDKGYTAGVQDSTAIKQLSYTPQGNIETETDGKGNVTRYHWEQSFIGVVLASTEDALGHQTTIWYDEFDRPVGSVTPNGATTITEYDGFGRSVHLYVVTPDNAPAPESFTIYSSVGQPANQTVSTTTTIDSSTNKQVTTEKHIDGLGRVFLEIKRAGATNIAQSIKFDLDGHAAQTTIPYFGTNYDLTQPSTFTQFDILGRAIAVTVPGGYTSNSQYGVFTYGGKNRTWVKQSTPNATRTLIKHTLLDGFGRMTHVIECSSATCSDPSPNPDKYVTSYLYDTQDNNTHICLSDGQGDCSLPETSKLRNFYDGLGHLIGNKDPDLTNCLDNNVDDINSGCAWRNTYDANGNLWTSTDAKYATFQAGLSTDTGFSTIIAYDKLNRPITKTVTSTSRDQTVYSFTYDRTSFAGELDFPIGQLTSMTRLNPNGDSVTKSSRFDSLGRAVKARNDLNLTSIGSNTSSTIETALNDIGTAKVVSIPGTAGTELLTSTFDDFGRVNSVSSSTYGLLASQITYDASGRERSRKIGPNAATTVTHNYREGNSNTPWGDQRLSSISSSTAGLSIFSDDITGYDPYGNVTSNYQYNFDYDRLNRLTSVTSSSGLVQSFLYDKLGNRYASTSRRPVSGGGGGGGKGGGGIQGILQTTSALRLSVPALAATTQQYIDDITYSSFGNAYRGVAGPHAIICTGTDGSNPCGTNSTKSFSYDSNGNMRSMNEYYAGGITRYSYDDQNKVIQIRPSAGNTVKYFYGPAGEKVATLDGSKLTTNPNPFVEIQDGIEVHVYGLNGAPLAVAKNGSLSFLHSDHLGSVRAASNGAGQVLGTTDYNPFGSILTAQGTMPMNLGFNGMERDSSGHDDFHARTFIPEVGFTQPDSIIPNPTDPQTFNRYSFVNNNPMTLSDPTGHFGSPYNADSGPFAYPLSGSAPGIESGSGSYMDDLNFANNECANSAECLRQKEDRRREDNGEKIVGAISDYEQSTGQPYRASDVCILVPGFTQAQNLAVWNATLTWWDVVKLAWALKGDPDKRYIQKVAQTWIELNPMEHFFREASYVGVNVSGTPGTIIGMIGGGTAAVLGINPYTLDPFDALTGLNSMLVAKNQIIFKGLEGGLPITSGLGKLNNILTFSSGAMAMRQDLANPNWGINPRFWEPPSPTHDYFPGQSRW